MAAVYASYYPDLVIPGAVEATRSFAELALRRGARRLALLSGRGEPEAERGEQAVGATGAELTILRSTWFMQNFSKDYMLDPVLNGEIRLPAGEVPTPFLDIEDPAEIAVEALTDDRHIGRLYELTVAEHRGRLKSLRIQDAPGLAGLALVWRPPESPAVRELLLQCRDAFGL